MLDEALTEQLDLAPAAAEPVVALPTVLGRYRLERRLGSGGFGVVWLAHDERLRREVAVKAIPLDVTGPAAERAEREARAAARLNHPGIVALYELGADDEHVYLVSELVRGRTFGDLLSRGALSDRDVARVGRALCDALAHAHERGVVHRDVKPGNVMVVSEPAAGAGFAKLADFGVAHLAEPEALTRTGDVVGTLAYMAPEQADGERVSAAADVYSLALTLYEGWTGSNPVRAPGPAATARRLGRPIAPLGRRRRDLPAGLCATIDLALDPVPERRPSLERLRSALAEAEQGLSDAGGLVEPGTLERLGLRRGRRTGLLRRRAGSGTHALAATGRRAAAGAAAGAVALGVLQLGPSPPFSPAVACAAAAALVAVFPRAGWLACALALAGWLASPAAGSEGLALVVLAGAATVPALLPRAAPAWSLPALAPLAGAAGLGPLYLAVAGLPARAWSRAGLGAAGFLWLALWEAASGETLLFGPPGSPPPPAVWQESLGSAAGDVLYPLASSPALAVAALWAGFAVALPLLVRGRSLVLDGCLGALWAAALVAAQRGLGEALAADVRLTDPRGSAAGATLAAALAVALARARPRAAPAPIEDGPLP